MCNNFLLQNLLFWVIEVHYMVSYRLLTSALLDSQRNIDFINTMFIKCKVNK